MGKSHEEQAFINHSAPIKEHDYEGRDVDGYEESSVSACGCGCFRFFCFGRQQRGEEKDAWLKEHLKQIKGVSELVAGPRWKNFVRKVGKYWNNKKSRTQYQYDPQSYALNFDHGTNKEAEEDLLLGFTSRFATPPSVDRQMPSGL